MKIKRNLIGGEGGQKWGEEGRREREKIPEINPHSIRGKLPILENQ